MTAVFDCPKPNHTNVRETLQTYKYMISRLGYPVPEDGIMKLKFIYPDCAGAYTTFAIIYRCEYQQL